MKKLILSIIAVCSAGFLSAETPASPTPKTDGRRMTVQRGDRRMQRMIWRAFAECSDAERREMIALQRNNPEKFREVINRKAQEMIKADRAERAKLAELAKRYQQAKIDNEKISIKKEISAIIKKRFLKRLASNRRHLAAMKRRAEKLEKELDKRAANTDRIVEFQTEAVLSGKSPQNRHPQRHHDRGHKRHQKPIAQ